MERLIALAITLVVTGIAAANKPLREDFYKPDKVQTIHLTVSKRDMRRQMTALPKRLYVPARFRWGTIELNNVAVRFKGNSSSRPNFPFKRGWLIRFDRTQKERRFLGMRRISLDNGIQFGSLFSEPILTDILRAEGVLTHRANYARLMLNGKFHGIYVNVERIDLAFLANRLNGVQGALYKVDEGGPGSNMQYISDLPEAYMKAFEAKTKSAQNRQELLRLLKFIQSSSPEDFAAGLKQRLAWDAFVKTMPVMLFGGAFDQLTGFNPHNYYLFQDARTKRWQYFPWDLDVGFADNAFGRVPIIDQWHAAWPIAGPRPSPLINRIVSDSKLLSRYRQEAKRILEKYFRPADMDRRLDAKVALIKKDLATDPFPHRRVTNPRDRSYDDVVRSMKRFFRRRYETARSQLASPGKRPKYKPGRPRGSRVTERPGKPTKSDPTDLKVVKQSGGRVELKWKDNGKNEVAYILQRATKDGPFRSVVGQPGDNITSAVDRRVRPGAYRYRVFAIYRTLFGPRPTGPSNVVRVIIKR